MDHEGRDFSGQKITLKPASQYHSGTLAVLVRYNQEFVIYILRRVSYSHIPQGSVEECIMKL